jgi:acyl dehydratase
MPLDQSFVGRTYPPTAPYEVGREKIREFAAAVHDPHPAYLDPEAAKALGHPDVIAPPTFPVIIAIPAAYQAVNDPDFGLGNAWVVHGDQRFVYQRPMRAGDRIECVVKIEALKSIAGSDMLTLVSELRTVEGELVCTAYGLFVVREDTSSSSAGSADTAGSAKSEAGES